ncbi:alkaline phosphatase D family protein [Verrucomicrobia bacterium]|nr:alkaline phosphatase D family protein [Verrucomicrobiota bacterium]
MNLALCFQSISIFRRPQRDSARLVFQIAPNSPSGSTGKFNLSRVKSAWLCLLLGGLACSGIEHAVLMAEEPESVTESFGLLAHWPFDEDYSSTVNNELYQGKPVGGDFIRIAKDRSTVKIGNGALRLDSGPRSGDKTYVSIRNPLFGLHNSDVFTVVAWYRYDDLSGDGSDVRNFVWESTPAYSLAFGLRLEQGQRDAEWWFQTASHSTISDGTGPKIDANKWQHAAMVWNRDQGHARFYHNGLLRDDIALPDGEELEEMTGFHIGNHRGGDGARDWDGYIDDVGVYDLELTPRQIRALAEGTDNGGAVHAGNILERVPEPTVQTVIQRPKDFEPPLPLWNGLQSQGPLVGHVSDRSAIIWARVPFAGSYDLEVRIHGDEVPAQRVQAVARETEDWCLRWEINGLKANSKYQYRIQRDSETLWQGESFYFHTAPAPDLPAQVTLVFGSCASSETSSIWTRIRDEGADGVVLLGDTPYIDVTDLDRVRDAYRRLSSVPPLAETFRSIPFWGTWDDHDFGRNDSDGTLPGKEHSRHGFVNYRPNLTFGHDDQGIYTKFRYGPVEVFLLDTRWFSRTEASWADPEKPTLLGKRQWEWLKAGLLASDASFKILACGMIWDDKKNSESDDWGTYMHERQALQSWLGDNQIEGVVLMGGDIHVSRLLKYDTVEQVGYPLYQFISSPMHGSVIPSLNVPHPALIQSAEEPFVFLKLSVDSTVTPAKLEAVWMNRDGKTIFDVHIDRDELSRSN